MTIREENFQNQLTPKIIADEYHNCDFSFSSPRLLIQGILVGYLLDVKAKFVDCNLTNRAPHPEAELINCNLSIVAFEYNYQTLMAEGIPIADEYHNCNFSFKEPLEKDGKKIGHLLDVKAKFVECNLINREPHPESVLVQCNTAIVDTEIAERVKVDHTQDIINSDLPEDFKKELLKTVKIEVVRIVSRPHKIYGRFDPKKREYVYREEVTP